MQYLEMFLYHLSMYNRNTIFNIYNHSKSSLKKIWHLFEQNKDISATLFYL